MLLLRVKSSSDIHKPVGQINHHQAKQRLGSLVLIKTVGNGVRFEPHCEQLSVTYSTPRPYTHTQSMSTANVSCYTSQHWMTHVYIPRERYLVKNSSGLLPSSVNHHRCSSHFSKRVGFHMEWGNRGACDLPLFRSTSFCNSKQVTSRCIFSHKL